MLIVGSLNFTTSSKASREVGARLELARSRGAVTSYIEEFERISSESLILDEAGARRPQLERASSSNSNVGPTASSQQAIPAGVE